MYVCALQSQLKLLVGIFNYVVYWRTQIFQKLLEAAAFTAYIHTFVCLKNAYNIYVYVF